MLSKIEDCRCQKLQFVLSTLLHEDLASFFTLLHLSFLFYRQDKQNEELFISHITKKINHQLKFQWDIYYSVGSEKITSADQSCIA